VKREKMANTTIVLTGAMIRPTKCRRPCRTSPAMMMTITGRCYRSHSYSDAKRKSAPFDLES